MTAPGAPAGGSSPAARAAAIVASLAPLGSEEDRAGMARFGIRADEAFGVSVAVLRSVARDLRPDHDLALALWETGQHEARLLACFVDHPRSVTEDQMESWVAGFDSWDVCDQATALFSRSPLAWAKVEPWARRDGEFVRRAAFTLVAGLAVHDRTADDAAFVALLPLAEEAASDERTYVKKGVSWALRAVGKRNLALNAAAIACAERIRAAADGRAGGPRGGDAASRAARWVAGDVLRELTSERIRAQIEARAARRSARGRVRGAGRPG